MSRPKKIILVLDSDDRRHGERRFIIETRCNYRVESCFHVADLAAALTVPRSQPDLLIVSSTIFLPGFAIRRAKHQIPALPALLLLDSVDPPFAASSSPADANARWSRQGCADVLALIARLTARKRGPKKRTPTPTLTQPEVARSAA